MASMNKCIFIGRLTRDPESRQVGENNVCSFAIAVDRKFSKDKEADFVPVTAWRRLGEICQQYLTKGKLVAIDGRLQVRNYEKDGIKRTAFEVVLDDMVMLSPKGEDGGGSGGGGGQSRRDDSGYQGGGGFPPSDDSLGIEDIPF